LASNNKPKHPHVPTKVARRIAAEAHIPVQKIAYSLQEISAATSLSVLKMRLDIKMGRLRAYRVGARVIILAADLESYLLADQLQVSKAVREFADQ
jgi:hypothetical protein